MKLFLSLTALSLTLFGQAQVIIERTDKDQHIVIELDSVTYNDASESLVLRKGKGLRSFRSSADDSDEKLSAEQRAALMTKRMTLHLDLNEKQERQVAAINQAHHQAMQKLRQSKEGFEKQSAILDEQIKHQRQLKELLDPVQYAKFKDMHEDMREAHHKGSTNEPHAKPVRLMQWKFENEEDTPAIQHHNMRVIAKRYEAGGRHEDGPARRKRSMIFMSDSEKPLMIIDGKEAEDETSMNAIDPNHIKSVEVLKGDAAIEKYGEKAKNGVILITTKK
jgi:TonB-dependent SusC/RagA subfamily outer membrane receptor